MNGRSEGINETLCAICYHLYNLKNVKDARGGVLLLKVILHVFFTFFELNGTKSSNASLIKVSEFCYFRIRIMWLFPMSKNSH